jgi:hypothetical protein
MILTELPEYGTLEGSRLYAVEFSNGTVKVGRTQHAARRLRNHHRAGSQFGIRVIGMWVSEDLGGHYATAERALIARLRDHAPIVRGNEYFAGISVEQAAAEAESAIGEVRANLGDTPAARFLSAVEYHMAEADRSIAWLARALDLHPNTVMNWFKSPDSLPFNSGVAISEATGVSIHTEVAS